MAVIVKNTTATSANWGGIDIAATSQYELQPLDSGRFLTDPTFKSALVSGDAIVNDGTQDLSAVDAVLWIQGYSPSAMTLVGTDGNTVDVIGGKLQVQITGESDVKDVKISLNDTVPRFLEEKIITESGKIIVTTENDGADEKLKINIGTDVFDKLVDTTTQITEGDNLYYTEQRVQQHLETNLYDVIKDPTGFENTSDSIISFDDNTRTFTITPTNSDYTVYVKGRKFTISASTDYQIPDVTGSHYLAFDINGDIAIFSVFSETLLKDYAFIAVINWSASQNKSLGVGDERHGLSMDWATHAYLHSNMGARVRPDAFQIGNFDLNGSGLNLSDSQFSLENGILSDEDLMHQITHSSSPSLAYEQILTPAATLPILYKNGTTWDVTTASSTPVSVGSSVAQYNKNTSGTWSLDDSINGGFIAMWVVATHYITNPIRLIIGQQTSLTLDLARKDNTYESLDLSGIQIAEFKVLYRLIFQTSSLYINSSKSRLVEILDLRKSIDQGTIVSTANDHGNLTGLADDDHPQYIKVDGTRPFTGDQSFGGHAITNVSTFNGIALESHKARHEVGGADAINHDNLTGFVANKHIDHSAVLINNGYGITGGGDMTASRTLSVGLDYEVNSIITTTIQTTSTSMNSTGLVVTLTPGIWFVNYSSVLSATSNGRLVTTELYINGAAISATESQYRVGSGGGLIGGLLGTSVDQGPTMAATVIVVTGVHTLELRWKTSGGTAIMQQRQITAIRIG